MAKGFADYEIVLVIGKQLDVVPVFLTLGALEGIKFIPVNFLVFFIVFSELLFELLVSLFKEEILWILLSENLQLLLQLEVDVMRLLCLESVHHSDPPDQVGGLRQLHLHC